MGTIFDTKGCFYRALDDEPVFVLLARDPCAAETVRYWVTLRQALIGRGEKPLEDHETLASALRDAQTMVVWRAEATDPADDTLGGMPRWCLEKVPERRLVSAALDREVEALRARVVELEGKLQLAELTAQPKSDHPDEPQGGHMMDYADTMARKREIQDERPKSIRVEYDPKVDTPAEILKAIADTFGISYAQMAEDYRRVHGIPDPIPSGVYWSVEAGNFYSFGGKNSFEGSKGMGIDFYNKWKDRQSEFPSKVHDEIAMPPSATERRIVEMMKSNPKTLQEIMETTSDTLDVTDTPDMPPHRFTMFTKAKGWAYGRGLEINPAHIPAMLDRMDADGWHLQCVLGGVEPTKVGMLFRRAAVAAEYPQQTFLGTFYGCSMWIAKDAPDSVQKKIKNILSPSRVEIYNFTADFLGRGMQP